MQIKIILFFLLILSLGFHVPSNAFANDGGNIVKVFELEHSPGDRGTHNSLVQVDSDTYALAYASDARIGYISTFTISQTIAEEEVKKSHDCYDCEAPKLTKVEVHITSQNSDTQRISTSSEIWNFDQDTPYQCLIILKLQLSPTLGMRLKLF